MNANLDEVHDELVKCLVFAKSNGLSHIEFIDAASKNGQVVLKEPNIFHRRDHLRHELVSDRNLKQQNHEQHGAYDKVRPLIAPVVLPETVVLINSLSVATEHGKQQNETQHKPTDNHDCNN